VIATGLLLWAKRKTVRRSDREKPYEDVEAQGTSFTIPELKWRELLFVGALVRSGEDYVRDPSRPLPAFRTSNLFPEGVRFRVREEGRRVRIERIG
jgi:hypothetical protein